MEACVELPNGRACETCGTSRATCSVDFTQGGGMTERISGVYAIIHRPSGRAYVGSSKDVLRRWYGHVASLRNGRHYSSGLLEAWLLDGISAFAFVVLEQCEPKQLLEREQSWYDAFPDLFNGSRYAWSPSLDPRVAEKISAAKRGKPPRQMTSRETRAKLSAALRGRVRSSEHIANLHAALIESNQRRRGTPWHAKYPKAWRQRISLTKRSTYHWKPLRRKDPEMWKKRQSAVRIGRHFGPHTADHRSNIGAALRAAYRHGRRVPAVRSANGRFAEISRA